MERGKLREREREEKPRSILRQSASKPIKIFRSKAFDRKKNEVKKIILA